MNTAIPIDKAREHGAFLRRDIPAMTPRTCQVGPVTQGLRRRTYTVYTLLCLLGLVPALLAAFDLYPVSAGWQAAGWGLWLPGAGFVAAGGFWILLFPLALYLWKYAMNIWVLSGAVIIPALYWIGLAIGAYYAAGSETFAFVWLIVPATLATIGYRYIKQDRSTIPASLKKQEKRRANVQAALAALDAAAVDAPARRELTADQLAAARFMFDLALQPAGRFDGFTRIDPFQTAALRYQLNYINYGLAALQTKYTPNFHGYLNQAQRYAIEGLTCPETCGYWKYESLWGNLRWNPDPIGTKDNIMLTGWSLIALATYGANTGDTRYREAGALQFKPYKFFDKRYAHDENSFVEALRWNWEKGAYYLFPCEPNFTYGICNVIALCGLIAHDRGVGTSHARQMYDRFIQKFEDEFLELDYNFTSVRSDLTGLSFFFKPSDISTFNTGFYLNAVYPGMAKRAYAIVRQELMKLDENGDLSIGIPFEMIPDWGNYTQNPGSILSMIALCAREHGDDAMADAALRMADKLLKRLPREGVLAYEGTSTSANLNLAASRWMRRSDWHDTLVYGPPATAFTGPLLSDCKYPDVLVARAVSDGAGLELVLHNGAAAGTQTLGLSRLRPGARYEVVGAQAGTFAADAKGEARVDVHLDGRTEISIRPQFAAV